MIVLLRMVLNYLINEPECYKFTGRTARTIPILIEVQENIMWYSGSLCFSEWFGFPARLLIVQSTC